MVPTAELATAVIDELAECNDSFRAICKKVDVLPGSMLRFILRDPELEKQYTRAKQVQMESLSEEIIEISDERPVERIVTESATITKTDGAGVQRNRMRVDTRKWLMSKLVPKKYGEKLALAGDADQPLQMVVRRIGPKNG